MVKSMQQKTFLWSARILVLSLMALLWSPALSMAATWQPQIYDYALPKRVIAIDKNKQQFHLYEKKSPLTLKATYPCTTGQVVGDKQVVNDLRTPEGVYFVGYKIAKGLDFKEYGGVAYTLNYPNPVDRLRGKTGYGIWIHSKGEDADIIPYNTRGCIAIERKNILEIDPLLSPGTAVVVGETLNSSQVPIKDTGTARHLRFRMEQWTRAWASRSQKFFDFYDHGAYTKAMHETFTAFKNNKERLFKILSWINIFNREVHVLEGPGYWVTWSEQFYRAPNLSTEGIRRLYWQRSGDGQFRIVGMEWIPRNVGMQAAYEKGQLVAAIEKPLSDAAPLDAQEEVPTPPPLAMPEMAESAQQASATTPVVQQVAAAQSGSALVLTTKLSADIKKLLETRAKAWQKRDAKAFYALYDVNNYGQLDNVPKSSFAQLKSTMSRYFRAPWLDMVSGMVQMQVQGNTLITVGNQLIYMPGKQVFEGEESLYWQRDNKGSWHIVAAKWQEKKLGMEAAYLEKISTSVTKFIEEWRKDWLASDLDAYMQHYAIHAKQGQRSKAAIAMQKKNLWTVAAPLEIQLSGLRVQLDPKGVRADMNQVYRSKDGKGDKGTKTLILEPYNGGWRIIQEDWAALP